MLLKIDKFHFSHSLAIMMDFKLQMTMEQKNRKNVYSFEIKA